MSAPQKQIKILITAGPTREPMDPVRYLTNASTGEMGFAIAEALRQSGARVTVVAGPHSLKPHPRIEVKNVLTAQEMSAAVKKNLSRADAFIATAAVSDFRFAHSFKQKFKKEGRAALRLTLIKNPDILAEAGAWKKKSKKERPLLVGFALETKNIPQAAAKKLKEKNLDLIIGNTPVSFSSATIKAFWLEKSAQGIYLSNMTKKKLGRKIAQWLNAKLTS